MFGVQEWIIIALVVLLIFGGRKLPQLARSLGSGISEFKKGISGQLNEEDEDSVEAEPSENNKSAKSKKSSKKA